MHYYISIFKGTCYIGIFPFLFGHIFIILMRTTVYVFVFKNFLFSFSKDNQSCKILIPILPNSFLKLKEAHQNYYIAGFLSTNINRGRQFLYGEVLFVSEGEFAPNIVS